MSIHFLSRTGIETEVSVTVGFCRGLASAMGFPEAMSSSSLVSVDPVTYLSTPFTSLTQEAGSVLKQRLDSELQHCIDLHDGKHLCPWLCRFSYFLRIHPFARVFFSFRGIVYSRHKCCISCPSFVRREKKYCPVSTELHTRIKA